MKWLSLVFFIFVFASCVFGASISSLTTGSEWVKVKCTGIECSDFNITIQETNTSYIYNITPKNMAYWNSTSYAYYSPYMKVYVAQLPTQNTQKLEKTGDLVLYKTGNGASTRVYSLTLTTNKTIKLFQLGNNSQVFVKQNITTVVYLEENIEINATLYKFNNESYVQAPQETWIKNESECISLNKTGLCYGAVDINPLNILNGSINWYSYNITSNEKIEYNGEYYYIPLFEQMGIKIDLSDICTVSCAIDDSTQNILTIYFAMKSNGSTVNIDPAYSQILTGSSTQFFLSDNTERDNLGYRLSGAALLMEFNEVNISSYVGDLSLYNNNGTLINGTIHNMTGGYDGSGAYMFDGINDYIDNLDSDFYSPFYTNNLTVSVWVKINRNNSLYSIVSKGTTAAYEWALVYNNATPGGFQMSAWNSAGTTHCFGRTGQAATINTWYHVVGMIHDGAGASNCSIYVNGEFKGSGVATVTRMSNTASKLNIGRRGDSLQYFNGTLDNVLVLPYALTLSQVQQLYNGSINNSNYIGKYSGNGNFSTRFVFWNESATFWNITASIADTNSIRSGLVNLDNSINVSNNDLVAYFPFENNLTDLKTGQTGNSINQFFNASGLTSSALFIPNNQINISTTARKDAGGNFTVSLWFKKNVADKAVAENMFVMALADESVDGWNFLINIVTSEAPDCNLNSGANVISGGAGTVRNTNWHHVVCIIDNTSKQGSIYLDGTLRATGSIGNVTDQTTGLYLGRRPLPLTNNYTGFIDEVAVYNRTINASEVLDLYKSGISRTNTNITIMTRTASDYNYSISNLTNFYTFNNGSVIDIVGGVNGTTSGTFLFNDSFGVVGNGVYTQGGYSTINGLPLTSTNGYTIAASVYLIAEQGLSTNKMIIYQHYDNATIYRTLFYDNTANTVGICYYDVTLAAQRCRTCGANCTINPGSWYQIHATGGPQSSPVIYVNGKSGAVVNQGSLTLDAADYIGGGSGASYIEWNGYIDEVREYSEQKNSASNIDTLSKINTERWINWGEWVSNACTLEDLEDNIPIQSGNSGQFMEIKFNLYSDTTNSTPYVLNYTVSAVNATTCAGGNCIAYTGVGNWTINCAENCTYSTPTNLNGNNLTIVTGNGYVNITAPIQNYTTVLIPNIAPMCRIYDGGLGLT